MDSEARPMHSGLYREPQLKEKGWGITVVTHLLVQYDWINCMCLYYESFENSAASNLLKATVQVFLVFFLTNY